MSFVTGCDSSYLDDTVSTVLSNFRSLLTVSAHIVYFDFSGGLLKLGVLPGLSQDSCLGIPYRVTFPVVVVTLRVTTR